MISGCSLLESFFMSCKYKSVKRKTWSLKSECDVELMIEIQPPLLTESVLRTFCTLSHNTSFKLVDSSNQSSQNNILKNDKNNKSF